MLRATHWSLIAQFEGSALEPPQIGQSHSLLMKFGLLPPSDGQCSPELGSLGEAQPAPARVATLRVHVALHITCS
jgi:hypothetical protein